MSKIGFIATETYYVDHLVSIWLAMPSEARGPFFCTTEAARQARKYGVKNKDITLLDGTRNQIAKTMRKAFRGPVLSASFSNWRLVRKAGLPAPTLPHGPGGEGPGNENWIQNSQEVDLMLVPTEYGRQGLPGLNCVVIHGQPKLDRWFDYRPVNPRPTLAISFRWREEHSAAYHYKPFLKEIKAQADAKGVELIGHGHPLKFKTDFKAMWEKAGIPANGSFEYVLSAADVYAADCSSSSFEFVGLDRPVIFLDCPAYQCLTRAPRFTQSKAGILNKHPLELIDDTLRAYEDPPEVAHQRRAVQALLHEGFQGQASVNAARALLEFYTEK